MKGLFHNRNLSHNHVLLIDLSHSLGGDLLCVVEGISFAGSSMTEIKDHHVVLWHVQAEILCSIERRPLHTDPIQDRAFLI